MPERSMIFPAQEYQRRAEALQREMAMGGFDALLLTTPADVYYVTGFLTRFWESPARPWFVVLPAGGKPVAVIPAIGAEPMGRTWLDDIRTWPAPDPEDDGVSLLSETLVELTRDGARIGLPMGLETHLRMPVGDYARVARGIGRRFFADATACIQRVREIKSEAEIERIRATCHIADAAFARVPDFAAPGLPLDRVFRDFQVALLDEGADWVSYVAGGAGPDGYGDVISPATGRTLQQGDVLMLDTGAVRDGYFCDFDRNFAIGRASDAARRAHAALHAATDVALSMVQPGMAACDLHLILTDALLRQGATPAGGRLGHGLGITLTEWPSLTDRDKTPLRAGMVLTLEPEVEVAPGTFLVTEENLVLRDGGAELLSGRCPAELPEILE